MTNDLTMISRYALMIGVGYLVNRGYVDNSLTEPFIALGLAIMTYGWKKFEDHKKKAK